MKKSIFLGWLVLLLVACSGAGFNFKNRYEGVWVWGAAHLQAPSVDAEAVKDLSFEITPAENTFVGLEVPYARAETFDQTFTVKEDTHILSVFVKESPKDEGGMLHMVEIGDCLFPLEDNDFIYFLLCAKADTDVLIMQYSGMELGAFEHPNK